MAFTGSPNLRSTKSPETPSSAPIVLEVLRELARIHIVGPFIDIDEHRTGAGLGDRLRGGDEGIRDRDDNRTGANAGRDQRETEGVRAATHSDAMLRGAVGGEVALELLNHRAADEACGS